MKTHVPCAASGPRLPSAHGRCSGRCRRTRKAGGSLGGGLYVRGLSRSVCVRPCIRLHGIPLTERAQVDGQDDGGRLLEEPVGVHQEAVACVYIYIYTYVLKGDGWIGSGSMVLGLDHHTGTYHNLATAGYWIVRWSARSATEARTKPLIHPSVHPYIQYIHTSQRDDEVHLMVRAVAGPVQLRNVQVMELQQVVLHLSRLK